MKLLYITNIPAPYRQKRFNKMAEIFPTYGIDFEVLYMSKIEPNRSWSIPEDSYRYKHKFFKGIHPTIGNFYAHFNPGLLLRLLKNDYNIAIVGGMASPTHWLAPFFINSRKIQIMSVESNLHSVERKTGFGAWVKKKLLQRANAYQITGQPQVEYIKFFNPQSEIKSFLTLPNLIDEEVFTNRVNLLRENILNLRNNFGVDSKTQMWILPARLIEIKGVIPFLELLENISKVKLYIIGDGALLSEIQKIIEQRSLPVVCEGFVQEDKMIEYYAAADLFVLPSLKDPSPLSPIEAIAASLPLLVSSRIGNLAEVLDDEKNGFTYDPVAEIEKAKDMVRHISNLSRENLAKMGESSIKIYEDKFGTEKNIHKYAESLKKLIDRFG